MPSLTALPVFTGRTGAAEKKQSNRHAVQVLKHFSMIFILLCTVKRMRKISMKSFAAESNGGQGKKFPALAVSKLVSFTDSDSRDKSFSPA